MTDHHSSSRIQSLYERQSSANITVRAWCNAAKSKLINEYHPAVKGIFLDLGCGTAGDLYKVYKAGYSQYEGVDSNPKSPEFLMERLKSFKEPITTMGVGCTVYDFTQGLEAFEAPYSTVSMMFSAQYIMTETILRPFIISVTQTLKVGGYFIGIGPNLSYIQTLFAKAGLGAQTVGNDLFRITLLPESKLLPNKPGQLGTLYQYEQFPGMLIREYGIVWERFYSAMRSNGFRCVLHMSLPEYLCLPSIKECEPENLPSLETVSLYTVFAFRKEKPAHRSGGLDPNEVYLV